MKVILRDRDTYLLRFNSGEEIIETLGKYCQEQAITAGYFTAIGAAKEVDLSFFDLVKKEYNTKTFKNRINLEIISLTGNISLLQSKVIVHAHGIFSDSRYHAFAGHVKRLVVSATCELVLVKLKGKMERKYDQVTGLHLLS